MITEFTWSLLNILFIDLVLAGDNSLIIAAATSNLEDKTRKTAIVFGTAAAALLRVIFLFLASWFLKIPYIYALGGAYIIYLAVKLLGETEQKKRAISAGEKIFTAIWIIASADTLMSLDNVLAIAGVAEGNFWLFIFGVCFSVPIIFIFSSFISGLMRRYPVIILVGSLVLARVGGKMIAEEKTFALSHDWHYVLQASSIILVLIIYFLKNRDRA